MAKLSRKNVAALADGVWIKQFADDDAYYIKTRGYPDAYLDAQARRQRKAAEGFGGDADKLPAELKRAINCETMAKHSFVDIKGLEDESGPVTAERVREILNDPDLRREYDELVSACFAAARLAQDGIDDSKEALAGNSAPSFAAT